MDYETIILERSGSVGKLKFNRPKVLNAYNRTLSDEIIGGFRELENDEAIRVIVLTGEGKAFMAGADINMVNEWADLGDAEKIRAHLEKMLNPNILEDSPKPTIAAINGLAFGMGCEIAMACDYRIATESAMFGQPEVKLGIIPGAGGSQRLMRLVGATRALEMISTGDPIDAKRAYEIGLLNRVVPDAKLWDEVEAFAGRLTDKSSVALDVCKKLVYRGGDMSLREGIEYERDHFCKILLTEDAGEGTQAFLEKRRPEFKGR